MKVLIVRPEPQATQLANLANELGYQSLILPLITIVAEPKLPQLEQLAAADIVIAVSQHAVNAVNNSLLANGRRWPLGCQYLAVGQQTSDVWFHALGQQSSHVTRPIVPKLESSEGLLALDELQAVTEQHIVILRGSSGRELLAEELKAKGARVRYIACYERQVIAENQYRLTNLLIRDDNKDYLLVATSAELLALSVKKLRQQQVNRLSVIVPSNRIANIAKQRGFLRVYQSQGASNRAIIAEIEKIGSVQLRGR